MVNMGARLKALRLEKRLSQADMAQRIGISSGTISAYELEQRSPSNEQLIKLATFLGVTTDYLLGIEKNRTLSVEGLTDNEVSILVQMIAALKEKRD